MEFCTKFEVVPQKLVQSVVANNSKSDFCTVYRIADSEEIRSVYSTETFSITATIRKVNSTESASFFTENCSESDTKDYTPLLRQATNSQTNFHNFKKLN